MTSFYQFCRDVMGFRDDQTIRWLEPFVKRRCLPRYSLLSGIGEPVREVYVLAEGCIVASNIDESGDFRVECIETAPGTVCVDANAFGYPYISSLNIRAGTDSLYYVISLQPLLHALENDSDMGRVYVEVLEKALRRNQSVLRALTAKGAADRYQWFLQEYPGLEKELPDKVIASYLGMSHVTLSRVRNAAQNSGGGRPSQSLK